MEIRDRITGLSKLPASQVLPNPKNWRQHPKKQREAMKSVLVDIGFAGAMLTYRNDDDQLVAIDGHLRREEVGDEVVAVLETDLSQDEADKLLATFDPLAAMATPDTDKLESLLQDIGRESHINDLLDGIAKSNKIDLLSDLEEPEAKLDEAAELLKKWKVEPGQIWEIKGKQTHRLMCGDSTSADDVGKLLGIEQPGLMVTDPPYGVEYDPEWRSEAAAKGLISHAARRVGVVQNDDRAEWKDAYRCGSPEVAYVWHAGRSGFAADVANDVMACDMEIRAQIVWRKPAAPIGRGHYNWQHECCWYAVRKGCTSRWIGDRSQSTVWDIGNKVNHEDENSHGTQKPLECMARPIRNHDFPQVYDPFCGSGTTIVACEQLNRQCFAMEIHPPYVAVILERLTQLDCKCELSNG